MSFSKYEKHQKSKHPNFVATHATTGKILYSSNDLDEFNVMKKAYRKKIEIEQAILLENIDSPGED